MVERGREQAEQGLELTGEAGVVIIEIQHSVKEVVDAVSEFSDKLKS